LPGTLGPDERIAHSVGKTVPNLTRH